MEPTEPFPAQPEPAIEPPDEPAVEPSAEPSAEPVDEPSAEPARPASQPNRALDAAIALALFAATFAVYFVSMRFEGPTPYDFHVLLANAIVNGQVNLPSTRGSSSRSGREVLHRLPARAGALLLAPIAYFWGPNISQQYFSVDGSLNVVLCYATLRTLFQSRAVAVWVAILHASGRSPGTTPRSARLVLRSHRRNRVPLALPPRSVRTRHFFWTGLFLSVAFLSRLTTMVGGIFFRSTSSATSSRSPDGNRASTGGTCCARRRRRSRSPRPPLQLPPLRDDRGSRLHPWSSTPRIRPTCTALQREVRLGSPARDVHHDAAGPPAVALPGSVALRDGHLIATPALIPMLRARLTRLTFASAIAALFIAAPNLMHGGNGFTQFGYRHTLDFLPFLLILIASGMREHVGRIAAALILASIVVNAWGVYTLSVLRIEGF
jgi:hypothetical protein